MPEPGKRGFFTRYTNPDRALLPVRVRGFVSKPRQIRTGE